MELRPIKVRLDDRTDLIGPTTVCPNGFEGLRPRPGKVAYYSVDLRTGDNDTLGFAVTSGWFEYNKKLKVVHDVLAGCSSASGTVTLGHSETL